MMKILASNLKGCEKKLNIHKDKINHCNDMHSMSILYCTVLNVYYRVHVNLCTFILASQCDINWKIRSPEVRVMFVFAI